MWDLTVSVPDHCLSFTFHTLTDSVVCLSVIAPVRMWLFCVQLIVLILYFRANRSEQIV